MTPPAHAQIMAPAYHYFHVWINPELLEQVPTEIHWLNPAAKPKPPQRQAQNVAQRQTQNVAQRQAYKHVPAATVSCHWKKVLVPIFQLLRV